ncbi:Fe-S cluster assembly protein SufD [Zymobacter palmae]|uniref:ABC-type transport system n=1 Tax=Zymobacter palmae TaxID=33074 RepID=A0A348HG48_9GAMM|nr:Fe-S cluster assembly protein SufD [Zymobacter palmae]BBG30600.1 ABC-type transport system [Zymobacter palmae]
MSDVAHNAWQARFDALSVRGDALAAQRQRGLAHFLDVGFPTRRHEAWKYLDLRRIADTDYALPAVDAVADVNVGSVALNHDTHRLVFIDGQFSAAHSRIDALPEGVQLTPLSSMLVSGDVPADLFSLVDEQRTPFTALNQAFVTDGAVLTLNAGCVVERPIELLFVSRQHDTPLAIQPRVVIRAERQSQASVLEHYVSLGDAANLTNVVTEIHLEDGAHLRHYMLQEQSQQDVRIGNVRVDQARDAHFASYSLTLGGALARNDLCTELNGENAQSDYWGLFFGQGRQVLDNHTVVNHNVPRTFSNENYKGILGGRARGIFNGRVYIKRDAQQVRGYQSNANLLLSDRAEIDTKPELEIYADDVQCSHGATTGQLDQDALFALRARGIDKEMARAMLTLAFAGEVLQATHLPAVAQRVEHLVAGELPGRFNLADLVDLLD